MTFRNFNSIKVRLKQEYEKRKRENRIFQFHKGTIKTDLSQTIDDCRPLFQFHKGTIKTFIFNSNYYGIFISIP